MSTLITILTFTFIACIISLFLVGLLLLKEHRIRAVSFSLVSFAAGALLATGLLDTFKEAVSLLGDTAFLYVLLSIAGFFILERVFIFMHHHDDNVEESQEKRMPVGLLMFGDGLHNFIDGASIAASFLISFPVGVVTSIAVFVHEIPHELGDFGILLHRGYSTKKVLLFNIATGAAALLGAVIFYYVGNTFSHILPILLCITTGNFIYLATVDLLPEIHHHGGATKKTHYLMYFVLGIVSIISLLHFIHE